MYFEIDIIKNKYNKELNYVYKNYIKKYRYKR